MTPIRDIFRKYGVLDAHGRHVNGTDKQTNHCYGDAYEVILSKERFCPQCHGYSIGKLLKCETCDNRGTVPYSMREMATLVMEVGVADGSSLLAWQEVFPLARVVGMDIHEPAQAMGKNCIEFHFGDQRLQRDCDRAAGGRLFDVIVEDATHKLENTLLTLLFLWRYVKPGGIYVVEEWDGVGSMRDNIKSLFPTVEIVDTKGPFGGVEPLVVLRKPTI